MAIFNFKKQKEEDRKTRKKFKASSETLRENREGNHGTGPVGVLVSSHITEKSALGSQAGTYVFRVRKETNKIEVRKAVEKRYGVKVTGVNIVNLPSKLRRVGRHEGVRPGYKKAVVTLQKGQTIEIE